VVVVVLAERRLALVAVVVVVERADSVQAQVYLLRQEPTTQ
jgi:hypothetical protein